jgi:hypothetical protein
MAQDTSFYSIVILIATILLIMILAYLGIEISKEREDAAFPPEHSVCPDFWQQIGPAGCSIPLESRHPNNSGIFNSSGNLKFELDRPPGYTNDPQDGMFIDMAADGWGTGDIARCNKSNWSKKYDIVWDGITNFNKCK